MIHFAIYTVATGQILYTGHSDASVFDILDRWAIDPDQSIALCEPELDQRQWRVVDGAVVARDAIALTASKTSFAADGVDEVTITGLPDPCTVTVAGLATWGPNEVLGGSLTLTATKPGDIRIIVARDPDFIAAEITLHATELGPGLDALKAAATLEVDRQAEACRLQFITPGAGQALEYSGGEQEALALLALLQGGGTPDPANYPFVVAEQEAQAEALGTAPELADIALEVATQSGQWRFVGALIKKLRRGAKLKIELATTAAEVRAAATVTWPSA